MYSPQGLLEVQYLLGVFFTPPNFNHWASNQNPNQNRFNNITISL